MKSFKSKSLKSIDQIPGPEECDGRGNVEGDLALFQLKMHKSYGRYVKFKLDADTVAISTTDAKVLSRCAKIFDKPEKLYRFLEPLIGKLMFLPLTENKALRHLTISKFSPKLIENNFDLLNRQIDEEIDTWINSSKLTQGILSIQEKTKALSMRITVALVTGQDFSESAKLGISIHSALEELLKIQYNKDYNDRNKVNTALNYINSTVKKLIDEKRSSSFQAQKGKIFLDDVLESYSDEADVNHVIKEILMAGYHTVASAVAWTLYAITENPHVHKKVYQEIDSLKKNKLLIYRDLSKLKYLNLVIKESARRYTVGPYTAREANEDLDIGGYLIPKGTIIFYPIWAVHMDPQYWPSPEKFNPERFDKPYNKNVFMPYGFGARNCPGINIAQVEILLILVKILQKLTLEKVPKFNPIICENFVLISKNDLQVKIRPREKKFDNVINETNLIYLGFIVAAILMIASKNPEFIFVFALSILSYYKYKNLFKTQSYDFKNSLIKKLMPDFNSHQEKTTECNQGITLR